MDADEFLAVIASDEAIYRKEIASSLAMTRKCDNVKLDVRQNLSKQILDMALIFLVKLFLFK